MMRKAALSLVVGFLFLALASGVRAAGYELPISGEAAVTFAQGDVTVKKGQAGQSRLAKGARITAPAKIDVGPEGLLELLLPDGSVLRFSPNTSFELVKSVADVRNRQVEVDVAMGDCWASVKGFLGEDSDFSVNSPTAVAGVAGTKYTLKVDRIRNSRYLVFKGKIKVEPRWKPEGHANMPLQEVGGPTPVPGPHEVTMDKWMEIVSAGYQFNIRADGRYEDPKAFDLPRMEKEDPWVRWNLMRDKAFGF